LKSINLLQKKIRAKVIKKYLNGSGINKCVCFSSGNAATELKAVGLDVVHVGTRGDLMPLKWFSFGEVAKSFNGLFDATSGHLPFPMLVEIAWQIKNEIHNWDKKNVKIETGSGETLVCLSLAFPDIVFEPVYGKSGPTEFNKLAPMNWIVDILKSRVAASK
jgi:hypothetical protein